MPSEKVTRIPASSRGSNDRETASSSNKDLVRCPAVNAQTLIPLVQETRVRRVLQKIQAGPHHRVRELAREMHLSPAHLQRLFKQETGVNLGNLLSENRLRIAAELLSTTDMEVKEIAFLTGYHHHSSFVRAFQRRFHRAPRESRRPPAA